jgi:hypothetical protein
LNIKISSYKGIVILTNKTMIIEDMINLLKLLIICAIIKMIIFNNNKINRYFQRHFISKIRSQIYLVILLICIEILAMVNIKAMWLSKKMT